MVQTIAGTGQSFANIIIQRRQENCCFLYVAYSIQLTLVFNLDKTFANNLAKGAIIKSVSFMQTNFIIY